MKDGRCIAGCKLRRIHVIGRYVHGVGKQLYMTRRLAAPPPPPPRCIEKTPASLLVRRLWRENGGVVFQVSQFAAVFVVAPIIAFAPVSARVLDTRPPHVDRRTIC